MAKYSEIRDSIKSGDMILWSASGDHLSQHDIETNLVKIATESQWTHVGIAWVEHGRVWVMDLTTSGCAPRLLGDDAPFYLINSPKELTEAALQYAFARFGKMTYSKWQAVLGFLKRLTIGDDMKGECAEFVLEVYRASGMAPTEVATPYWCMVGALSNWKGASLTYVTND